MKRPASLTHGFTLIELSIVLVIIGLIVGGIVAGKHLVETSQVRAQISQIEKYNTAVNAFKIKYNGLPGDILNPASLGLFSNGMDGTVGKADGNGMIESWRDYSGYGRQRTGPVGETLVFWRQLSDANLLDKVYGANMASTGIVSPAAIYIDTINSWLPQSKISSSNFVVAYGQFGKNYFQITSFIEGSYCINDTGGGVDAARIPPIIAAQIDGKIDDGLPLTGNVQPGDDNNGWGTASTPGNGCTIAGTPITYAVNGDMGNRPKCTLSFKASF